MHRSRQSLWIGFPLYYSQQWSLPVPTVSDLHIEMPGIFKMGKSKATWEVLQTECYSRI